MIINRIWAMPNKWTFKIPCIEKLVTKYAGDGTGWIDPFAGQSTFGQFRNDLNPLNNQPFCFEAALFMKQIENEKHENICGAIFDPPYSLTQVSRSYQEIGLKFHGKENPTGGFPKVRDAISRLLPQNGVAISFGWNTVGMGKGRGFQIEEILIVCHGGNRNDTLCVVERKL